MFYSQFILAKKGPLGTIWIAAHLERKLRKNQVADTDIGFSVDSILFPEVPIALRLSSHLLLGVVRIYSRKVNYLFDDCSEALLKVKQAFRSAAVDLPPEESTAPYHSITLPETFDLDDFELPDTDLIQGNYADHHVSTREQITLQETMEGVIYSTSKFGLDERFGDGDTSQIGLDLDEELLLDKGETSGHGVLLDSLIDPIASGEQSALLKGDEWNENICEASKATPADCINIQAPSTPGLVEEPNLLSTQEAQVSDDHATTPAYAGVIDHMDDAHNPVEPVARKISGAASCKPEVYQMTSDDVLPAAKGNVCLVKDLEVEKAIPQGDLLLEVEPMELAVSNNGRPSLENELITVSNGPDKGEYSQNGSLTDNETSVVSASQSKAEHGDAQEVGINSIDERLSFSRTASSVLEVPGCDPCTDNVSDKSHINGFCPSVSDRISEDDKPTLEPEVLNTVEVDLILQDNSTEPENRENQACLKPDQLKILSLSTGERMSSASIPLLQACNSHLDDVHERMLPASNPAPQPCNSHLDDAQERMLSTSIPSPQACSSQLNDANALDGLVNAPSLPSKNELSPLIILGRENAADISGSSTVVQEQSNLDGQQDNMMPRDSQLVKENIAANSDLLSPEKFLSIPDVPDNRLNDLLVDSTPAKETLAKGDEDSAVDKISGQKRSYTESTLTLQSINSAQSFGAALSKKSVEFIPNDDDLLSSILVGRQSTVLKVKPTPSIPDIVSAKRRRVAPRTSPYKRKVLTDDAMVLHGDTIRQQLLNTEDVRRVRKKVPCTRPEMWMLQMQLLEDEIFSEPVLTGLSLELARMHSQPFDLSGTNIVQDEGSAIHSMAANDGESYTRLGVVDVGAGFEGTYLPSVGLDEGDEQCGVSLETPNQQRLKPSLDVDANSVQKEIATIDNRTPQHDNLGEKTEFEISSAVSLDIGNLTDEAVIQSSCLNKTDDSGASLQVKEMCPSLNQNLELQSVGNDASVCVDEVIVGISGGEGGAAEELDKNRLESRSENEPFMEHVEGVGSSVGKVGIGLDRSLHAHDASTFAAMSSEDRENESASANRDEFLGSYLQCDDKGLIVGNHNEDLKLDACYLLDSNLDAEKAVLDDRENLKCQEADTQIIVDPTSLSSEHIIIGNHGLQDWESDIFEQDTDFLNFDDDIIAEDDNSMANTEETHMLENSGWSARTRAVANYLQGLFYKEAQQGRKVLHLDNLLAGKSRKEASRMFFETLVLKTKDYIDAEQEEPFCNVSIKSRSKLMKSEF
ncbi:hypothetical protein Nepgr_012187 [Nepenthes gracilis]|uniref:Sister chromatid cohesion 1 protein 4-like n=1 Tax=Nepenthes gracilis TaxID=150966 RepID=A0AAD3SH29_NEPGR|nr:hypothetical protein Nepgr_012187 [Nepenthes gracilis]